MFKIMGSDQDLERFPGYGSGTLKKSELGLDPE